MRWPWQRDDVPHPDTEGPSAAAESRAGWAFTPPLQRTIGEPTLTMRPLEFVADLPTRARPMLTGEMSHVVSPVAPWGVLDGDGDRDGGRLGSPSTSSPDVDLALVPPSPPVRRSAVQRRTAGTLTRLASAPQGLPTMRVVPVEPPTTPVAPPADLVEQAEPDPSTEPGLGETTTLQRTPLPSFAGADAPESYSDGSATFVPLPGAHPHGDRTASVDRTASRRDTEQATSGPAAAGDSVVHQVQRRVGLGEPLQSLAVLPSTPPPVAHRTRADLPTVQPTPDRSDLSVRAPDASPETGPDAVHVDGPTLPAPPSLRLAPVTGAREPDPGHPTQVPDELARATESTVTPGVPGRAGHDTPGPAATATGTSPGTAATGTATSPGDLPVVARTLAHSPTSTTTPVTPPAAVPTRGAAAPVPGGLPTTPWSPRAPHADVRGPSGGLAVNVASVAPTTSAAPDAALHESTPAVETGSPSSPHDTPAPLLVPTAAQRAPLLSVARLPLHATSPVPPSTLGGPGRVASRPAPGGSVHARPVELTAMPVHGDGVPGEPGSPVRTLVTVARAVQPSPGPAASHSRPRATAPGRQSERLSTPPSTVLDLARPVQRAPSDPEPAAEPAPEPEPAAAPPSTPAATVTAPTSGTPAPAGASPFATASAADLDELARRLTPPLLRRVRGQLLVDRERRGVRVDL